MNENQVRIEAMEIYRRIMAEINESGPGQPGVDPDEPIATDNLTNSQVVFTLRETDMGDREDCPRCGTSYARLAGFIYYNGHDGDGWIQIEQEDLSCDCDV